MPLRERRYLQRGFVVTGRSPLAFRPSDLHFPRNAVKHVRQSPSVMRLPETLFSELREQALLQGRAEFID